jgi:hypothetical protein
VSFCPRASFSMASRVGTTSLTPRRSASSVTSAITGSAPSIPLPTTSRRHLQGMSPATESGVWPNRWRCGLEGCLPAFPNQSAVDDEVVAVGLAVDLDGSECQVPEAHSTASLGGAERHWCRAADGRKAIPQSWRNELEEAEVGPHWGHDWREPSETTESEEKQDRRSEALLPSSPLVANAPQTVLKTAAQVYAQGAFSAERAPYA